MLLAACRLRILMMCRAKAEEPAACRSTPSPDMKHAIPHARIIPLIVLGSALLATPASADSTLFMAATNGATTPSFGVAWGKWRAPVGFEVELSQSPGGTARGHGGSASFGVTVLVNTPFHVHGARLYGSAGLGLFARTSGNGSEIGGPAHNVGGGARIPLTDHLLLRLDYRAFFIELGDGDYRPGHAHRIAAGISVAF